MTTPLVLFFALTGCTALLHLWTGLTALSRDEGMGKLHRTWALTSATLLLPATLVAMLAEPRDAAWLPAVHALLPMLAMICAWCNITTLQSQSFLLKTLHLPVFLFNALLGGIYAVRLLQDHLGLDLGSWGTAVTAGHALLQTTVGQAHADQHPSWLYLPILLPVSVAYRWPQAFALLCCSTAAAAMLALLVTLMPFAYTRAHSFRVAAPDPVRALPAGFSVGIALPPAEVPLAAAVQSATPPTGQTVDRPSWQIDLEELGAHAVTLEVRPEVLAQPELVALLRRRVAMARALGLRVTAVTRPGEWPVPGSMHQLTLAMARVHWLAAEKLAPDVLVLYAGPFGRLAGLTTKVGTVDEWYEAIQRGAAEVRQANARVRVAVALESRGPHAEELFRRLRAADSPVDIVGVTLLSGRSTFSEVTVRMGTIERWLREDEGPRPVHVFETGAGPHTSGGELGQWCFLQAVLRFAVDHGIDTVAIDGLVDDSTTAFGLVAETGHRRLAYRELQRLLRPDQAQANPDGSASPR